MSAGSHLHSPGARRSTTSLSDDVVSLDKTVSPTVLSTVSPTTLAPTAPERTCPLRHQPPHPLARHRLADSLPDCLTHQPAPMQVLNMPGMDDGSLLTLLVRKESPAGAHALGAVTLPGELQFKGRVRLAKLDNFFRDVKKSTSRQVSLPRAKPPCLTLSLTLVGYHRPRPSVTTIEADSALL